MTTSQTDSAVAVQPHGIRTLLSHEAARKRIEPFLPPGASFDRVMAGAHYAARQNPAILQCSPQSIIDAVARIQQWGLEIGLTAHLVPFKGVCTPIADYKGLAELMVRSGAVRHVEARVVYERDTFSYCYGLDSKLEHHPRAAAERGAITHAYVIFRLPFGRSSFEVMPIEDIEEIRKRYSKQWSPDKVKTCPVWYAKKTVVRQAAKLIPKDPRLAAALQVIEDEEAEEFDVPAIAGAPRRKLNAGVPDDDLTPADTAADLDEAPPAPPVNDLDETWIEDADALPLNDKRRSLRKDAIRDGGR